MREQAHVIQKEVEFLAADIGRLSNRVESLRGHFALAERDIGDIEISAGKIGRRAEHIERIQLENPDVSGQPAVKRELYESAMIGQG